MIQSIKIYGDQAVLINFEQQIDTTINAAVVALQKAIEQAKIDGVSYMIPAYCSLTIGYNPIVIEYGILQEVIKQIGATLFESETNNAQGTFQKSPNKKSSRQLKIPVCYEAPYALDLEALSKEKGLTKEKIIALHTSQTYKVYLLGFLPGFVFMGKIVPELECNRKVTPRLRVPASSVGIAGFQTGIYPTVSPGGWQILGQTPLKIFDPHKENPFLFQAGDEVSFYAITKEAFLKIEQEEKQ